MTALPQREEMVADIEQARQAGARLKTACMELGLSSRTFERWQQEGIVRADGRPDAARPEPAHKLSEQEREQVLAVCHEPRFTDLPPAQIVPRLADEGVYIASESSFYRVLRAAQEQHHRGRAKASSAAEPQRHVAYGPNEIWSWDVTYLPSKVRGMFFYLYAVIDLFSRKLVAWEVHACEVGDEAAALIERASWREHRRGEKSLVLHADNGAAQKAHTLKSKLETLGITPSHSRPGCRMITRTSKHGSVPASTALAIRRRASKTLKWRGFGCSNSSLGTTASTCTAGCRMSAGTAS